MFVHEFDWHQNAEQKNGQKVQLLQTMTTTTTTTTTIIIIIYFYMCIFLYFLCFFFKFTYPQV